MGRVGEGHRGGQRSLWVCHHLIWAPTHEADKEHVRECVCVCVFGVEVGDRQGRDKVQAQSLMNSHLHFGVSDA